MNETRLTRLDRHGGTIRVPIDVVIANALETPDAPAEMDTVQGREAWEAGYEAALNAVSALSEGVAPRALEDGE